MRVLSIALAVLGLIQIANGAVSLVAPSVVAEMYGAPAGSPGVHFLLATAGARFIGYGIGMVAAAWAPRRHQLWIITMLGIQVVDFVAIMVFIADGTFPVSRFGPTVALPLVWVVVLGWVSMRNRRPSSASEQESTQYQPN
ncbi:hypothetical protein A5756_05630 [Mycobacterium sp. 852002-53434_SCH5985345]|uniref:hypothetical protein n=1 Tax=unclassified Mycobacterium TaxID=2642494 RepID=UPI0007FBF6A1|nr:MULTISPECIES: hypothetical protein [unclassified Mycobacterium]OBF59449.1 hypothetical protein A5756_05630 [Mycobacterium sp. 852002-53434_SCH5985345]OBF90339.1 hypothetical protein A5773_02295 [Mycobacterium sp. 852014-52450_SCH5900713]